MYDDLARTQRPSPLEWLVLNMLVPSILLTIVSRPWGNDVPRATPRDGVITAEVIPVVTPPASDFSPLLLSIRLPEYPVAMRRAGTEGRVVLRALVDMHGRVRHSSIEVLQTTHPRFNTAARQALGSALFRWAPWGLPVESWVTMVIEFHLFPE